MLIAVGSGKPFISGVRNAAGQESADCSPEAPATLTRSWLSAGQATASDRGGDSTELAGARVIVNGKAASMLAVSPERIDFLCPEQQPGTRLSISVENEAGDAPALETIMQPPAPAILTREHSGRGQGLVMFSGTSLLAASRAYEGLLTIMATGIDPIPGRRSKGSGH
jgi:uncharacterized protein (TIGR03437 family)